MLSKQNVFLALLVASLTLLCLACGQGSPASQLSPEPIQLPALDADVSPATPVLPRPGELAKAVMYLEEDRTKDGAQFEPDAPFSVANLTATESLGIFTPQWTGGLEMSLQDMAYGIYSYSLPDYDQTGRIYTTWQDGFAPREEQAWYLALADFDRDAWHWFSPPQDGILPIDEFAPYLSPSGVAMIVVAVLGTDECRLERLRIGGNILPIVDIQADTTYGSPPLTVNFDASASIDYDGGISLFSWDFDGDGTPELEGATETQVQHTYNTSGDFSATVTVSDADGGSAVAAVNVTVNLPPTASLAANPLTGSIPLAVSFNAGGSNDPEDQITDIQWDFDGDGEFNETGSEQDYQGEAISHYTYNSRGLYSPSVKVVDQHAEEDIAAVEILVNAPPNAVLSATPLVGIVPAAVSFDGSTSSDSDGTIEDWEWDFNGNGTFNETGDEADSYGTSDPVVNYSVEGGYTATLRVTDNDGAQASASQFIELGGTWEHTWGLAGNENFIDVATDSAGNVFATGDATNPTDEVLLAKFGPSGGLQWSKTWHSPTAGSKSYGRGIVVDASDNVYVTGHTVMRDDGKDDDLILLKFDNDGVLVWERSWGGEFYYNEDYVPLLEIIDIRRREYGQDLAVDASGNIYLTGYAHYREYYWINTAFPPFFFEALTEVTTLILLKFDADGNLLFQRDHNIGDHSRGEGVAIDNASGLAYCAGFGLSGGKEKAVVIAWDLSGAYQQTREYGSSDSSHAYGVCVNPAGNLVVTGETNGFGQGGYDMFLFEAEPFSNADPLLLWERSWGGAGTEMGMGIYWDTSTNQYIIGGLTNSMGHGGYDMFSLAYNGAGTLDTQQAWGTANDDTCLGISFNEPYGHPVAVGVAPNTNGAAWTDVSGTSESIIASWTQRTGNTLDLAYTTTNLNGFQTNISGVLDTGGGGRDAMIMQFAH